jgi:hypothetical protein
VVDARLSSGKESPLRADILAHVGVVLGGQLGEHRGDLVALDARDTGADQSATGASSA